MKSQKGIAVLLSIGLLLAGCSAKPEDTVSLPILEISDSEKLPYNEWEDVPYQDSFASELQLVAAELEIAPLEVITYLRYDEGSDEDESDECSLSFNYKDTLAFGKFILIGESWHTIYIIDAKTAEIYYASPEYEDKIPFSNKAK